MRTHRGQTWLDDEELAYSTATGTPHGSRRRAYVRCEDGSLRTATVGVPDTFFSIPGFVWRDGSRVHGYVTGREDEFIFIEYRYRN